jgi:bacteriocin biosynthesis cyclodehydratase domain-containing protein
MNNGVRLKDIDIIEMSGNTLQVRLWGRIYLLEMESDAYQAGFLRLLKLLDGRHGPEALAGMVDLPAAEVRTILSTLQNMSLTEMVDPAGIGAPPAEYLRQHQAMFRVFEGSKARAAADCQRRVHQQQVLVLGDDPLATELAARLPEFGLHRLVRAPLDAWPAGGDPAALVVLPLSDYHHREVLAAVNRRCVEASRTLLPVYFDDGVAQIGPTVVPGKTACLACLELRLVSNVDNQEALASYRAFVAREGRRYPSIPTHLTTVAAFVCHELLRVCTGYEQARSYNGVLRLDLWSSDLRRGRVLRFPGCPVCSGRARRPKYDDHAFAAMLAQL